MATHSKSLPIQLTTTQLVWELDRFESAMRTEAGQARYVRVYAEARRRVVVCKPKNRARIEAAIARADAKVRLAKSDLDASPEPAKVTPKARKKAPARAAGPDHPADHALKVGAVVWHNDMLVPN